MSSSTNNILGLFVKITDVEKCHENLNEMENTKLLWPNQWLRNKSCRSEWSKFNFYPDNGQIGEIVAKLNTSEILDYDIYIVRILGTFYVPISVSGFEQIDVVQLRLKNTI